MKRVISLLIVVILVSCSENESVDPFDVISITEPTSSPQIVAIADQVFESVADPEYYLDWEAIDFIPRNPDKQAVPMPWSSLASRKFSDDILHDFKKQDGWVLVYNTFTPGELFSHENFILYNKYRGILRYYLYVKDGTQAISTPSVLVNGLRVSSNSESPAVSFNTPVTNIDQLFQHAFKAEPQSASNYTWYAFQYEIAYDQFVDQYTYQQYSYNFPISFKRLSSTEIDGVNMTTLPCTIIEYGGNFPQLSIGGVNDMAQINSTLLNSDVEAINNFLSGNHSEQVLNGNQSESGVNLVWNKDVKFFSEENFSLGSISYAVPGYDQAGTMGLSPFYNRTLGVFYLAQKPQVGFAKVSNTSHQFSYSLDASSVKYLFNPAVTEIAGIENIRQELVAVRKKTRAKSENTLFFGQSLQSTEELRIIGVRVSFDVVPKDGSNRVHIVKTFDAEVVD